MYKLSLSALALLCQLICLRMLCLEGAMSNKNRVLLEHVKVLTLHQGQMTSAQRAGPVPQLKCIGGSANCEFIPKVVQCLNQGSDGSNVQWECKTDMDNSYRFGQLSVSCEGYDFPDDPYILQGSCGLVYALELTEEGRERKSKGHQSNDYYKSAYDESHHTASYTKKASSIFLDLFYLAVIAGIIYIIYKTCLAVPSINTPPSYDSTFGTPTPSAPPPPYGFRQEYMPNMGGGCSSGASYTDSQTYGAPQSSTGGGFWSGIFTGGMMGYLLGNRNNTSYGYQRPYTSWWGSQPTSSWGTGWGSGSSVFTSSASPRSSYSSTSSGTRTASGYGGTTRR